jgi:hypothetical protein
MPLRAARSAGRTSYAADTDGASSTIRSSVSGGSCSAATSTT